MSIEHHPRVHQFGIGQSVSDTDATLVGIVERSLRSNLNSQLKATEDQLDPIFGVIENFGDTDFTFSVLESNNNNYGLSPDAYAGINIRIAGADVADILVPAKSRVPFSIEVASKAFLRFEATDPAVGRLTISHFFGALTRRERSGVA